MCYKGKCFMCIPVEHGCLVFAIISAVVTGLAVLASLVLGVLTGLGVIFTKVQIHRASVDRYGRILDEHYENIAVDFGGIAIGILIFIVGVAALIAFIFSVLLCNGICKRRPGQVKAYFVYGVVITVLAVLSAVGYLVNNGNNPAPGIVTLLSCVIYSLFLVLVHQTYAKMLEGVVFKDHMRLVES